MSANASFEALTWFEGTRTRAIALSKANWQPKNLERHLEENLPMHNS
jgi:hypothetical protein